MKTSKGRLALVLAAVGSMFLVAACGGGGNGGTTDDGTADQPDEDALLPIVVAVAPSSSSVSLRLGVREGFFEEEGLDVTITDVGTGADQLAPLVNGQQQFSLGGISTIIPAIASDLPLIIGSGGVNDNENENGSVFQTIVAPDSGIERFRDLEGKVVGALGINCCWEFWLREAIEKDGGDPSAVEVVQLSFPDQVTALKQGRVDAVSTSQPFATQLRLDGFRDIGNSAAIAFDNPNSGPTVYFTSLAFIAEHPDGLERWRRALQKASDYANANPDEVIEVYAELTGGDAELLAQAPLPLFTAEIDVDTVLKEAGFLVKYGVLDEAPSQSELIAE